MFDICPYFEMAILGIALFPLFLIDGRMTRGSFQLTKYTRYKRNMQSGDPGFSVKRYQSVKVAPLTSRMDIKMKELGQTNRQTDRQVGGSLLFECPINDTRE